MWFRILRFFTGAGGGLVVAAEVTQVILNTKRTVVITNNSDTLIKIQCLNPGDHQREWGSQVTILAAGRATVVEEAVCNNVRPDIQVKYYVEDHLVHQQVINHDRINIFGESTLNITGSYGREYRNQREAEQERIRQQQQAEQERIRQQQEAEQERIRQQHKVEQLRLRQQQEANQARIRQEEALQEKLRQLQEAGQARIRQVEALQEKLRQQQEAEQARIRHQEQDQEEIIQQALVWESTRQQREVSQFLNSTEVLRSIQQLIILAPKFLYQSYRVVKKTVAISYYIIKNTFLFFYKTVIILLITYNSIVTFFGLLSKIVTPAISLMVSMISVCLAKILLPSFKYVFSQFWALAQQTYKIAEGEYAAFNQRKSLKALLSQADNLHKEIIKTMEADINLDSIASWLDGVGESTRSHFLSLGSRYSESLHTLKLASNTLLQERSTLTSLLLNRARADFSQAKANITALDAEIKRFLPHIHAERLRMGEVQKLQEELALYARIAESDIGLIKSTIVRREAETKQRGICNTLVKEIKVKINQIENQLKESYREPTAQKLKEAQASIETLKGTRFFFEAELHEFEVSVGEGVSVIANQMLVKLRGYREEIDQHLSFYQAFIEMSGNTNASASEYTDSFSQRTSHLLSLEENLNRLTNNASLQLELNPYNQIENAEKVIARIHSALEASRINIVKIIKKLRKEITHNENYAIQQFNQISDEIERLAPAGRGLIEKRRDHLSMANTNRLRVASLKSQFCKIFEENICYHKKITGSKIDKIRSGLIELSDSVVEQTEGLRNILTQIHQDINTEKNDITEQCNQLVGDFITLGSKLCAINTGNDALKVKVESLQDLIKEAKNKISSTLSVLRDRHNYPSYQEVDIIRSSVNTVQGEINQVRDNIERIVDQVNKEHIENTHAILDQLIYSQNARINRTIEVNRSSLFARSVANTRQVSDIRRVASFNKT